MLATSTTLLLFLWIAAIQAGLIYFQHFSPFEKESNLRAVLWGASPARRYWAVLLLDGLGSLLIAFFVLSAWPTTSSSLNLYQPAGALMGLLVGAAFSAAFHHYLNAGVIRFPNYGMIARRWGLAGLFGLAAVAANLLAASIWWAGGLLSGWQVWLMVVPRLILPAFLLALLVFLLRALVFYLRVLPLLGNFLHAAASFGLLAWLLLRFGQWVAQAAPGEMSSSASAGAGLLPVMLGVSIAALISLWIAAWLPVSIRQPEAVEPLPLVVAAAEKVQVSINITGMGATLEGPGLIVSVTRRPFKIVANDPKGHTLWELSTGGLARSLVLQKVLAIPLLYTGNTIKFKWHLSDRPIADIKDMRQESGNLLVEFMAFQLKLGFYNAQTLRMQIVPKKTPARINLFPPALSMSFVTWPDSHFLGFGQRFNRVDQRGEQIYFLVEEGGVGYAGLAPLLKHIFGPRGSFPNGEQCTGFPVPFGLFSRETGSTTGLFWNTYQPSWIDLPHHSGPSDLHNAQPKNARLTVLDQQLDLFLFAGPEPLDAVRQYTSLTGQPNLPPAWLLLPWKTQTGAVVEADVFEDIQRFRELEIPLAQVGVEHWQNIRGSYEFSPEWFPNMQQLVDTAHEQGYRIHIWHFPYMNAGAATHLEGVRKGYFIKNRLGLPYQQRIFHGAATVLDYSNPLAATWHAGLVSERFHRVGFDAVMTDYAESIPPDSVFYNGRSGLEMRNAYPLLYCQAMQGAAQTVLGDDYAIYPRAGYAGSQRYVTVQWPGDQDTDWDDGDGLPAAVRAMLNVSMCGFPVHGSDVGGWYDWFAPITTKELYLRWAEVGAYSPLMRAHGGPIGRNREPWKFDQETVEIYRNLSEEHVRLFPYLYSLSQQAARDGTPLIRHPSLMWPAYPELYPVEDSWCIGEALYVAPVIQPGQTRRKVLLPPGEWWLLSENRPVGEPERVTQLEVESPLGQTPVFLRRGFILPRFQRAFDTFDPVDTARVGSLRDDLEIWLFPGQEEAVFRLFDGTCLTYSQGARQVEGDPQRSVTWKIFSEA